MDTEIIYNIKVEVGEYKEEISFKNIYNSDGDCTDEYSYNPISGNWTNIHGFTNGWSEQEDIENELLNSIKEFVISADCDGILEIVDEKDIGKTFTVNYHCNEYVEEPEEYTFKIEIEDIENIK